MNTNQEISEKYLRSILKNKNEISHEYFNKLELRTDASINQNSEINKLLDRKLTKSSVLIPIVFDDGNYSIILTYRSADLKDHASQISFPGGRIDAQDASPVHTAIRETYEEVGIEEKYIEIIGNLDTYVTGTGYQILPIISLISQQHKTKINSNEVESIFKLPLSFLMDASNHQVDRKHYNNGSITYDYNFNVINYNSHYIWGATASILINLYEILK